MDKSIIFFWLFVLGFLSCKNPESEVEKLKIAKKYYKDLDSSDYSEMSEWFADSLKTTEGEYIQVYSKSEYLEFLKWDAVFRPNYKILTIEEKNGVVKAKISKIDKRISFLHQEPFITKQTLKFFDGKIISVETEYVDFNEATWGNNKNKLVNWVEQNYPELNGFLYDQTESGAIKFRKAIELYENYLP